MMSARPPPRPLQRCPFPNLPETVMISLCDQRDPEGMIRLNILRNVSGPTGSQRVLPVGGRRSEREKGMGRRKQM